MCPFPAVTLRALVIILAFPAVPAQADSAPREPYSCRLISRTSQGKAVRSVHQTEKLPEAVRRQIAPAHCERLVRPLGRGAGRRIYGRGDVPPP